MAHFLKTLKIRFTASSLFKLQGLVPNQLYQYLYFSLQGGTIFEL